MRSPQRGHYGRSGGWLERSARGSRRRRCSVSRQSLFGFETLCRGCDRVFENPVSCVTARLECRRGDENDTREMAFILVPTAITYVQLYPGPDGETHFREVTVPLTLELAAPPAPPYAVSAFQTGTTIRHVAWPANWGTGDRDAGVLHNAVSARFVSVRRGELWIRAGCSAVFEPLLRRRAAGSRRAVAATLAQVV